MWGPFWTLVQCSVVVMHLFLTLLKCFNQKFQICYSYSKNYTNIRTKKVYNAVNSLMFTIYKTRMFFFLVVHCKKS